MALPVTISGAQLPNQNSNNFGPFRAPNGAFYVVALESTGGTPEVYKATDPTSSFTAQDTVGNPVAAPVAMAATIFGPDIFIATAKNSSVHIQFHKFSTTTDTWTTVDETIESLTNAPASADLSVAIGVRSDGDVIVLYNGQTDSVHGQDRDRVDYARNEGAGWTVGLEQDQAGTTNYHGSVLVRGEADKMHFFWATDGGVLQHRSLNSANSNGTTHTVDTGIGSAPIHHGAVAVYYDDAGVERITIVYGQNTNTLSSAIVEDDGTPGSLKDISTGSKVAGDSPVASGGVAQKTVNVLFAQSADSDLFFSDNTDNETSWLTPTEELDAVTINAISANVYPRDGVFRLAYVYDDGGTVKYNEKDLAVVGPTFANALFPVNPYNVGPYQVNN